MKFSFWDILATLVMLMGLALAIVFINIFVNPNSILNPFPPAKAPSQQVPSLTPSQRSLPELWSATPETPGVPSVTSIVPTRYMAPTQIVYKTMTRTPNRTLTAYYAYRSPTRTPTRTSTSSSDTTPPTYPGNPATSSPTSDSTPTWIWTASTDSSSGLNYYLLTWGGDINCNNPVYASNTNVWTAPVITSNTIYYICVRARDKAGNETGWVGPTGFYYSGPVGPATLTPTSTHTPTKTSTNVFTPTATHTFTSTFTATNTLTPTFTATSSFTPTETATFTNTVAATDTLTPTFTATSSLTPTETATFTFTVAATDTLTPTFTATSSETPTETATFTVTPTETETLTPSFTATSSETPTETATFTVTSTETVTMTPTETPTVTSTLATSFIISGNTGVGPTITPTGPPIAAVNITVTGDPGAVVTQPDGLGNYSVIVPANWSGDITPSRIGYKFTLVKLTYTNVSADTPGQDFTSIAVATHAISGNAGTVPGGTIIVDNGAVVTQQPDAAGDYIVIIPTGWSGSITPSLPSCTYMPDHLDFTTVGSDLPGQNFIQTCP